MVGGPRSAADPLVGSQRLPLFHKAIRVTTFFTEQSSVFLQFLGSLALSPSALMLKTGVGKNSNTEAQCTDWAATQDLTKKKTILVSNNM
jgi:hypothetical protein